MVDLELDLDPFLLEGCQHKIVVDLALLLLIGVNDNVDEQVGDEKGTENHIGNKNVLNVRIVATFRFHANVR